MDWAQQILEFRQRKHRHFASGQGPFAAESFSGLHYYPPDPSWAFELSLLPPPLHAQEFALQTNEGGTRFMQVVGQVQLSLPQAEAALLVFAPLGEENPQQVFVPFRDQTSGTETYAAGRYLDAPLSQGQVKLDFNLAYQPYCAYGEGWTCPLPPAQNVVPTPVRAGEKLAAEG